MKMSYLNDNAIAKLRAAVERIMSEMGLRVENEYLRTRAKDAGAIVDGDIVRFPPDLMWALVAKTPRSYTVSGVNGPTVEVGGGGQYHASIVTDPFIADYPTGAPRRPCLADVTRNTMIIAGRPDVATVSRMDFPVTDYAGPQSTYRALEAHLLNHDKAYSVYPTSYESFMEWMDLAPILANGRELKGSNLFTVAMPILSPMVLTSANCDIMLEAVKYSFPLVPTVCPMAGSTSPYTTEGTLAQGLAEVLAVDVMLQLINPGNPYLFAFGPSVTHLQTGHDLYYTMDKAVWKAASADFAHSLGLPCSSEVGGTTGIAYDMQSGAELMAMAMSAIMSGAEVLAGAGSCYNANGLSSEHILMSYAFIDAARFFLRDLPLDTLDESLDSIFEQQPGGNFLTDELTLRYMRDSRFFHSPLFDTAGEAGTPKPMLERAHEAVERIVADFKSPVPGDVQEKLKKHFHDFCARL